MAVRLQSNYCVSDGPFDAGLKTVSTKAELKTISDPYDGMIVAVTETDGEGLYVLYHADNLFNWVKIAWDVVPDLVGKIDNINIISLGEGVGYSFDLPNPGVEVPSDTYCYYTYGTDRGSALALVNKPQSPDGHLDIPLTDTDLYVIAWLERPDGEDIWRREELIEAPWSYIELSNNTYADEILRQTDLFKLRILDGLLEAYCKTTNTVRVTLNGQTTDLQSGTWTQIPNTEWHKKLNVEVTDINNSSVGSALYEVVMGKGYTSYPTYTVSVNEAGQFGDINVSKSELDAFNFEYTITAPSISSVKVSSEKYGAYNFNLTKGISKSIETAPDDSESYYIEFLWEDTTVTITEENSSIPSDLKVTIAY